MQNAKKLLPDRLGLVIFSVCKWRDDKQAHYKLWMAFLAYAPSKSPQVFVHEISVDDKLLACEEAPDWVKGGEKKKNRQAEVTESGLGRKKHAWLALLT